MFARLGICIRASSAAKASSQAIQQNSEEHPGESLAKCQLYATDAGAVAGTHGSHRKDGA
jgi:hypothetical protein